MLVRVLIHVPSYSPEVQDEGPGEGQGQCQVKGDGHDACHSYTLAGKFGEEDETLLRTLLQTLKRAL